MGMTPEGSSESSAHRSQPLGAVLLLLSRFSRVRLCATPWTAAHQASLSMGFSRQEHWSGLPFPSPMHESESEVAQSCLTLSDPMDCSLPGSSIHGIFQATVLQWVPIAFSHYLHSIRCLWVDVLMQGFPGGSAGKEPACHAGDLA